jgi:hypothetical protein
MNVLFGTLCPRKMHNTLILYKQKTWIYSSPSLFDSGLHYHREGAGVWGRDGCMRTRPGEWLTSFIGRGAIEVALSKTAFELCRTPHVERLWSLIREGGIDLFLPASIVLYVDQPRLVFWLLLFLFLQSRRGTRDFGIRSLRTSRRHCWYIRIIACFNW